MRLTTLLWTAVPLCAGLAPGRVALAASRGRARASRALCVSTEAEETYDTNELVVAARKGKIPALTELLAGTSVDVDLTVRCDKVPTMDHGSALIWAARQGQLEATQLLIGSGANVNAATGCGWTPLYAAALNGHESIVEELIGAGADIEATLDLNDERTNRNLLRMAADVSGFVAPTSPPAASAAAPAAAPQDWKAASKAAVTASGSSGAEDALAGMSEIEQLRLRLDWRAPPTFEEQRAADARRQTVFKYRYDRIQELEAGPAAPAVQYAPLPQTPTPQPPPAPLPPPQPRYEATRTSDASVGVGGESLSAASNAAILARLEAAEAALAQLRAGDGSSSSSGGFGKGFERGFEQGFAAGFAAAGRVATES